jgi:hypothetical protein
MPPHPPVPVKARMLLKTNGKAKNGGDYPTMSMILNGLLLSLRKAVFCFQYDRLWKSWKILSSTERSHDVYDGKGVSLKIKKAGPLFSIGYPQEIDASSAAKPTICMADKDLEANRHPWANSYVIENRARSALALKGNGFRTHDVDEAKRLSPRCVFLDLSRAPLLCSLHVASS